MLSRTITHRARTRPARTRFLPATFAPFVLALACGCGGAEASDLFDAPTADASVVMAADANGSGSDDSADAANAPDGGAPGPGTRDASDGATVPPRDSGPPHTPTTVLCGALRCSIPAQECCRTRTFGNELAYACVNKGACFGFESLAVPCDDAADCAALGSPGQLCCYSATSNGVNDVRCRPAAECLKPSRGNLCDPAMPTATTCPNASGPNVTCVQGAVASFDFSVCVP